MTTPSDGGARDSGHSGHSAATGAKTRPIYYARMRTRYEHERLERIRRAVARLRAETTPDPDGDDGKEGR